MKIAFIGGGSVQWTLALATDLALNPALVGAELVLHDIDADALDLLTRACQRVGAQLGNSLRVTSMLDRRAAIQSAAFVILCVSIGGLAAMRNDLEIPARYGIQQSVGDTVGPGGLARGLRHIPFAIQVAREMEQLCPNAWLLNLTNPMTTICRAVTRATSIRTIGLCHEVTGVRHRLADILNVPFDEIVARVAGINHLPVILDFNAGTQKGLPMLREWLARHGAFARIDDHHPDPMRDVFTDRLAVKLTLFEQLGVLFGAGDRHVAEFFPGLLTDVSQHGLRYGVQLTTIAHREQLMAHRRALIAQFVAGESRELIRSEEQLTSVMAALGGGKPGTFIVNVPNRGQIENLPRDVVVECDALVDALGVHPITAGALPNAAYAAIAPHVARQELIVEAGLTGKCEPALAALATDPLVVDPATVAPMFDELMQANRSFVE